MRYLPAFSFEIQYRYLAQRNSLGEFFHELVIGTEIGQSASDRWSRVRRCAPISQKGLAFDIA